MNEGHAIRRATPRELADRRRSRGKRGCTETECLELVVYVATYWTMNERTGRRIEKRLYLCDAAGRGFAEIYHLGLPKGETPDDA